jgi:hypothetical protein
MRFLLSLVAAVLFAFYFQFWDADVDLDGISVSLFSSLLANFKFSEVKG